MRYSFCLAAFLCLLLFDGCVPVYQNLPSYDSNNLSSLYNPVQTTIHPDCKVFHSDLNESVVMVRIRTDELLFNKANEQLKDMARVRIQYRLFQTGDTSVLSDSATHIYSFAKQNEGYALIRFRIKTSHPHSYMLHLIIYDEIRNKKALAFLPVNKEKMYTAQSYMVLDPLGGEPVFTNFFTPADTFRVAFRAATPQKMVVSYFAFEAGMPAPPFAVTAPLPKFQLSPDSTWVYPYNDTLEYRLPYQGIYRFSVDSLASVGLHLACASALYYPRIKSSSDMISPLSYICTTIETDRLRKAENKKLALDEFWVTAGGNIERARELIRVYYNRVQLANFYFASYCEGWKTDRGMIYTVFGPPTIVTKNNLGETWIYSMNSSYLSFTFDKAVCPFSDNHFTLRREAAFSQPWRKAVESWRNGRPYTGS